MSDNIKLNNKNNIASLELNRKSLFLFKFINRYFWKSIYGYLFAIILPLLIMIVYYVLSISKERPYEFTNSYSGVISFSVAPICLFSLLSNNMEFKKSFIYKKLVVQRFNFYIYFFILVGYYLLICVGFVILNTIIFLILASSSKVFDVTVDYDVLYHITFMDIVNRFNIGSLIFSSLLTFINFALIGFGFSYLLKSFLYAFVVAFSFIMICLLTSGLIIATDQWTELSLLRYIALINPFSATINLMNISITFCYDPSQNNIFDFTQGIQIVYARLVNEDIYYWYSKLIFFLEVAGVFIGFSIKIFLTKYSIQNR